MNERIKELWDLSRNPSGRGHDEQKFAELILKEVIIICDEVQTQYGRYTFTATTVKDRVKEHFGVEDHPANDVDRILRTVRTRGVK